MVSEGAQKRSAAQAPRPCREEGDGAMRRPRRRRKRKGSKHLTISARNAEWEEARAKADRRELSLSRYVRMLLDRDVSGEEKTFTALAPEEQRELLEGVQELRALRALLTEEAAAPAREEETAREPPAAPAGDEQTGREPPAAPAGDEQTACEAPAAPAQDEQTGREPAAPRTPEDAGQAESSDSAESCDPAEPDEPEPGQGQLPF